MDIAIASLILILLLTIIVGHYLAGKYFYQGYETGVTFPLILFLTVLANSVGILIMMVKLISNHF